MSKIRRKKIFISSIGSPAGYGVVKALLNTSNINIIGLDANEYCPFKDLVNKFYKVPKISDRNYLNELKKIIDFEGCDLFIPTIQPELYMIKELSKMSNVLSSDYNEIVRASNKKLIYELMIDNGLSIYVPKFTTFLSDQLITLQTFKKIGFPESPICIKPYTDHGGINFKVINVGTIELVSHKIIKEKDSTWMTLDELINVLNHTSYDFNLMALEYLPGSEYSVDALVNNGEVLIAVPRKRVKVNGGIVVQGVVEKNDELINATKKILSLFDFNYFINIQFKYDNNGIPKLIDINPRFCGSHIMSLSAGVNFPLLSIKMAFGEPFKIPEPKWGTNMIRYWESYFYES